MSRKFLNRRSSYDDVHGQYIVYRKTEPNTFSNFVDKVIGDFPVAVSARRSCINPNNPIEVLKDKGLINISRSTVRTGDCPSDVKLSFFSEESRCGETKKLFSSNHHFKHGQLVYSSTHEFLPQLPRRVESFNECWAMERQREISAGRDELRSQSETAYNKSERKKLTDILQDVEKQRMIQRFEGEARKRHLYSRSLSPRNLCYSTDPNRDKYLQTLRAECIRKKISPFTRVEHKSPGRFRYHAATVYKHTPVTCHPQKSACIKSSSEISVTSTESRTYSSPRRTVKKASRYEDYIRSISQKPKINTDLFVIPAHTCCTRPQIARYRHIKTYTHGRFVTSPGFRHGGHQRTSNFLTEKENTQYERETRESKLPHGYRMVKSSTFDSRVKSGEDHERTFNNKDMSRGKSPLKGILSYKQEMSSSKYSPRQRIRFSDSTYGKSQIMRHSEDRAIGSSDAKRHVHGSYKHKYTKDLIHRQYSTSTDGEIESDSTSKTLSSVSDSESSRERKEKEGTYKHSETSTKVDKETRTLKDRHQPKHEESSEKKRTKKRRQINPNKIVHLEDSGRRLSQYYDEGKTTMDSEKAFGDEEKIHSSKITLFNRSPKRSTCCDRGSHAVTFREESLDRHLRRTLLEDRQRELIQNIVNEKALEEYKDKYADCSVHSKERKATKVATGRNYDEHRLSVNEAYISGSRHGDCEACVIERLLTEED